MHKILITTIFASVFLVFSCTRDRENRKPLSKKELENTLIRVNQALVTEDKKKIEEYIKRNNLEGVKQNGSGLYYIVWGDSSKDLIQKNSVVEFRYKVSLLDGTVCYQSDDQTPRKFIVGQGGVEAGLEQSVILMRPGQKGKFILPPHLAYGLTGDNNKIPPRAIIVYDIEMLAVYR